ncbi:diadenylate cyclase CdaA [Culicoidibacter larvae]|uniref:Diadenylate cyclase n=1 Tax=Culicoidibacter larvae TaxID=2579976 RepID=A0A5R8QCM3_9FIRM|nr:diadenylate cyclase CdaA [Culicoidibacter larvae]TLG74258.1 TIGR00159 family protein [Culicoidibacter larvae]
MDIIQQILNFFTQLLSELNYVELIRSIIEIGLLWLIIYGLVRVVRLNVRMIQILKGIVIIVVLQFLSQWLGFTTISWVLGQFINWGFLFIIIIFQPEIRSGLEHLGRRSTFIRRQLTLDEREMIIRELSNAVEYLSKRHIGALITIERNVAMNDFVSQAIKVQSQLSAQLLTTIFTPNTPLHDGAVIIQGTQIACAGALFPTTTQDNLPPDLGTRHRAALGISEITDSMTLVVSEETGLISIAVGGELIRGLQKEDLVEILKDGLNIIASEEVDGGGGLSE